MDRRRRMSLPERLDPVFDSQRAFILAGRVSDSVYAAQKDTIGPGWSKHVAHLSLTVGPSMWVGDYPIDFEGEIKEVWLRLSEKR